MQKSSTRMIVEAGLMVAVFSVLSIIARYFPFLSLLTLIFPIPFIVIYLRHNAGILLMTLVASSIIGSLVTQDFIWLFLMFVAGPMAFAIGFLMKREKSTTLILLVASIVSAFGMMLMVKLTFQFFATPAMPADLGAYFEMVFKQSAEMIKAMDLPNSQKMIDAQLQYIEVAKVTMPSLFLMTSFIITTINLSLTYKLLSRLRIPFKKPGLFRDFTLPSNIMLGITIFMVLVFALGALKIMNMESMLMNVITLFMFIFSVQGMATISGWLLLKGYKSGMVTGLIVFLMLFNMMPAFALLGWLDLLFDFRKLKNRKTEN